MSERDAGRGTGREPTAEEMERAARGRRRREPRYRAFIGTGAVVGLLVAVVLALLGDPEPEYSRAALFGYLAVSLVLLGGLLGGLVAALATRRR